MSLNGLDAPAVVQAHRTALVETGGWLLLQYVNRDTVELLGRGNGGVAEIRKTLDQFTEKSPVYGLIQHKRKRCVLKYVPEGTSRLLQVRLTVHFQSILDSLVPHEAIFSFSDPAELTESALSLCALLNPTSGETHQRRLNGISEVAEDGADLTVQPGKEELSRTQPSISPATEPKEMEMLSRSETGSAGLGSGCTISSQGSHPNDVGPERQNPVDCTTASATTARARALLAKYQESAKPPASSTDESDDRTLRPQNDNLMEKYIEAPDDRRSIKSSNRSPIEPLESFPSPPKSKVLLSTAEAQSITQWSNQVASYVAPDTPRKKLGPRPHIGSPSRSARTSTTIETFSSRPVANLPNSVRLTSRNGGISVRPNSSRSTQSMPSRLPSPPEDLPPLPSLSHIAAFYKAPPAKSEISRPASVNTEASTITPEKMRLMRALQLRKKSMYGVPQKSSSPQPLDLVEGTTENDMHSAIIQQSAAPVSTLQCTPNNEEAANAQFQDVSVPELSIHSPATSTEPSTTTTSTSASSFQDSEHDRRSRDSASSTTSSSLTPRATITGLKIPVFSGKRSDSLPKKTPEPAEIAHSREPPNLEISTTLPLTRSHENGLATVQSQSGCVTDAPHPKQNTLRQSGDVTRSPAKLLTPLNCAANTRARGISVTSSQHTSDYSENDSLMNELQHAIFEEAKSMSVARSPVMSVMPQHYFSQPPKTPDSPSTNEHFGSKAGMLPKKLRSSPSGSSTALPAWPPQLPEKPPSPLTIKGNVGSGISRRIKALEIMSNTPSSPRDQQFPRLTMSNLMKRTAVFSGQAGNSTTNLSLTRHPSVSAKSLTTGPVPVEVQKIPIHAAESSPVYSSPTRANVYSVTAKIVRDENSTQNETRYFDELAPINLHQSPLIVEQHTIREPQGRPVIPKEPSQASIDTLGTLRSEAASVTKSSRRSESRPRNSLMDAKNHRNSQAGNSKRSAVQPFSDSVSMIEEKTKESRASRLIKRMSSLAPGGRRKSRSASPTKELRVADSIPSEEGVKSAQQSRYNNNDYAFDIGDVNVQFPETVLWKRRFMRVDNKGNLIFSPSSYDTNFKILSRRYRLSNFKIPALPDLEREEMAWSILLEMKDGNYIQCACENRQARHQVLKTLIEAHNAFSQVSN